MLSNPSLIECILHAKPYVKEILSRKPAYADGVFAYYSFGSPENNINYNNCTIRAHDNCYIDIFDNQIRLARSAFSREIVRIYTEGFKTVSEEEFFMQSTLQDFSFFEGNEEFLKDLITISLMIREQTHEQ